MSSGAIKSENKQSIKVLEELLAKLTVSKAQDEINGVSQEIAIFINGDIEEEDATTKYVKDAAPRRQLCKTCRVVPKDKRLVTNHPSRAIETLKKDNEERKSRETTHQTEQDNTPILGGSRLMLTQGPGGPAPASPMPYGQQANGITPQATGYRAF